MIRMRRRSASLVSASPAASSAVVVTSLSITGARFLDNGAKGDGDAVFVVPESADELSVTASCFAGNGDIAVFNSAVATPQDFTGNWWGSVSGPTTPSLPEGTGDSVGDGIDFSGFLTTGCAAEPALVLNEVAPISESGAVVVTGLLTDPELDAHDLAIDWDDANASADAAFVVPAAAGLSVGSTIASSTDGAVMTVTAIDLKTGAVAFRVQHTYLDDGLAPGNGTASDLSSIIATVSDDEDEDGGLAVLTTSNVAPVLSGLAVHPPSGEPGDTVTLTGTITDPGTLDVFALTIDWGDGNVASSALPAGSLGFSVDHVYASAGVFAVVVTLQDDDGGQDQEGATVTTAAPVEVPTLSPWGMLTLVAAIAALARARLRRRGEKVPGTW
jgi:hypothetical protein